jgi:hypothetical protein
MNQMKHVNLKKAVEKYAEVTCLKENERNPIYKAELDGIIIRWSTTWYSKDDAELVRVHHAHDKDEWVSDYCAGSFYDTIKSAIEAFTYNYRKRISA